MLIRGVIASMKAEEGFIVKITSSASTFLATVPQNYFSLYSNFKVGDRVLLSYEESLAEITETAVDGGPVFAFTHSPDMSISKCDFPTIADLALHQYTSLYAVVVSCKPLTATRGTDHLFTLKISDETGEVDLRVFISDPRDLEKFCPPEMPFDPARDYRNPLVFDFLFRPGDIILIRNIKLGQGGKMALVHKSCDLVKILNTVDAHRTPQIIYEVSNTINSSIILYLIAFYTQSIPKNQNSKRIKDKRISDIELDTYVNVIGQVVYFDNSSEIVTTVCITDYTLNPKIPAVKRGRYGLNALLYINVYGSHRSKLSSARIGDIYRFENVKIKDSRSSLTSHMSESKQGGISVVTDADAVQEILGREKAYFGCTDASQGINPQTQPGKAAAVVAIQDGTGPGEWTTMEELNRKGMLSVTMLDRLASSYPVKFVAIQDIQEPGLYFIKCKIHNYEIRNTAKGPYLRMTIGDDRNTMKVVTRQRLTKLLINSKLLTMNVCFSCLILSLNPLRQTNFVVNTFFEDEEILELIDTCAK